MRAIIIQCYRRASLLRSRLYKMRDALLSRTITAGKSVNEYVASSLRRFMSAITISMLHWVIMRVTQRDLRAG